MRRRAGLAGAARAGDEQAERNVEGERGGGGVASGRGGCERGECGGEAKCEACLARDRETARGVRSRGREMGNEAAAAR